MTGTLTRAGYLRVWIVWLLIAGAAFALCMMLGQGDFGTRGVTFGWPEQSIRVFRVQRILAAGIVGMALAAAGVTLQALLRNPLAEPYVLGISSGSAVGVMLWLLLTGPLYAQVAASPALTTFVAAGRSIPAVTGALLTCILVFAIARRRGGAGGGGIEPVTLLLVGVVVSAMNAAVLMVVNAMVEKGLKADLASYMLGSILESDLSWKLLASSALVLLIAYVPVILSGPALNVGSLSDVEATSMGVNLRHMRLLCFISASVMTGAALMLSGPIGFVGLICPHICRRLGPIGGADHRKLVVAAPLCGAAFLMLADTGVRVTQNIVGTQFPVGVVTALCGGPFFLFLLRRGRIN